MKEQHKQNAFYIAYYQHRVSKNVMLQQLVPSADKIYEYNFPKEVIFEMFYETSKEQLRVVLMPSMQLTISKLLSFLFKGMCKCFEVKVSAALRFPIVF